MERRAGRYVESVAAASTRNDAAICYGNAISFI